MPKGTIGIRLKKCVLKLNFIKYSRFEGDKNIGPNAKGINVYKIIKL